MVSLKTFYFIKKVYSNQQLQKPFKCMKLHKLSSYNQKLFIFEMYLYEEEQPKKKKIK